MPAVSYHLEVKILRSLDSFTSSTNSNVYLLRCVIGLYGIYIQIPSKMKPFFAENSGNPVSVCTTAKFALDLVATSQHLLLKQKKERGLVKTDSKIVSRGTVQGKRGYEWKNATDCGSKPAFINRSPRNTFGSLIASQNNVKRGSCSVGKRKTCTSRTLGPDNLRLTSELLTKFSYRILPILQR